MLVTTVLDERWGYAHVYTARCAACTASIVVTDKQDPLGGYALTGARLEAVTAWNTRA